MSFKTSSLKSSKDKFFSSKHDHEIQKIYLKENSQNVNTTNTSRVNKSRIFIFYQFDLQKNLKIFKVKES